MWATIHAPDPGRVAPVNDQRRAADAMYKVRQLYPGVIGEVLADEINYATGLLQWAGPNARAQRLITAILDMSEVS